SIFFSEPLLDSCATSLSILFVVESTLATFSFLNGDKDDLLAPEQEYKNKQHAARINKPQPIKPFGYLGLWVSIVVD
ncbi:hypothetical protein ABTL92_19990, partial [Acinetobacter baumannii]